MSVYKYLMETSEEDNPKGSLVQELYIGIDKAVAENEQIQGWSSTAVLIYISQTLEVNIEQSVHVWSLVSHTYDIET